MAADTTVEAAPETYEWQDGSGFSYQVPTWAKPYEGEMSLLEVERGPDGFRELAAAFGYVGAALSEWLGYRNSSSVSTRCKRWGIPLQGKTRGRYSRGGPATDSTTPPPDPENPVERDRDTTDLSYFRKRTDFLERELARLQDSYNIIGQVVGKALDDCGISRPLKPYVYRPRKGLADEELTQIFVSDVHIGELVRPADTGGLSSYSHEVFLERCERYKDVLRTLIDGHLRQIYPLRKAFVVFLGDCCTGEDIFPMQPQRIDLLLMEQIVTGAVHLGDFLRYVAAMFEEVYVYMVPGNHGRTHTTTLNTDRVMYTFMAQYLHDQPNLHFVVSDSDFCGVYVDRSLGLIDWPEDAADERWSFLYSHGNNTKGWAGIPYYGLDRYRLNMTALTEVLWDRMYQGHFHTRAETEGWTLVGSWVGGTDFSVGRLQKASPPTQLIEGLHPKTGPTWSFPVYLGEKGKLTVENAAAPGVYTPHNQALRRLRGEN